MMHVAVVATATAACGGLKDGSTLPEGGADLDAHPSSGLDATTAAEEGASGNADGGGAESARDAPGESSIDAAAPGDGSTPWWTSTNSHGCLTAGLPKESDRPAASDPGPDLPPIYLAMSRLREGSTGNDPALTPDFNAWKDIGFDMDGVCTNSATCQDPVTQRPITETACQNSAILPYDGDLCRDNVVGKLYAIGSTAPDLSNYFGFTEQDHNCELYRGGFGIIFKISGYNGQLNDTQVRLDMYTSLGLVTPPAWTCRASADSPLNPQWYTQAPWLSVDPWTVASESISLAAAPAGPDLPDSTGADPDRVRAQRLACRAADRGHRALAGRRTHAHSRLPERSCIEGSSRRVSSPRRTPPGL